MQRESPQFTKVFKRAVYARVRKGAQLATRRLELEDGKCLPIQAEHDSSANPPTLADHNITILLFVPI